MRVARESAGGIHCVNMNEGSVVVFFFFFLEQSEKEKEASAHAPF